MELLAIRHPPANITHGICYGQLDVPLKPGWKKAYGEVFAGLKTPGGHSSVRRIVSSPLLRCVEAASEASNILAVPWNTDERIMEISFGRWEGKSWDELWEKDEEYRIWCETWQSSPIPAGEALPLFHKRITSFLKDPGIQTEGPVVLLTHAGVIRALQVLLQGQSLDWAAANSVEYGAIYSFETDF